MWPEALVDSVVRLCVNDHSCVAAPTQQAAIAALEGPRAPVEEMLRAFDARRRTTVAALDALPGVSCPTPGGAFYAFPDITGTGLDAQAAQDLFLEEAGVATIAGTSFGAHGAGHVRVSYANAEEAIRAAAQRLHETLAARGA